MDTVFLRFFRHDIRFLLRLDITLACHSTRTDARVVFVNRFVTRYHRFQIIFRPLNSRYDIARCTISAAILRVRFYILMTIVQGNDSFQILVRGRFLIYHPILCTSFFTFRLVGANMFTLLARGRNEIIVMQNNGRRLLFALQDSVRTHRRNFCTARFRT